MAADITGVTGTPVEGVRGIDSPAPLGKREGAPEQPVAAKRQAAEPKAAPSVAELESIASEVQIRLKRLNTELRFEIEDSVEDVVVTIVDKETNEVIRQIPSEEMVAIRERIDELIGFLYDAKT
jgi:flagellar protein FlaG